MIKVITIDREYASGGAAIAKKLADERKWTLWDTALTSEIAALAKCKESVVEQREERNDPLYYRLFKSFLRGNFEGSLDAQYFETFDADAMFHLTQRVVRRIAAEGNCVIVGRGSAYFLQDMPDVFHVFVYATREDKMRRLHREGKSWEDAVEQIESVDRERAAFVKRYYSKCWPDRYLFNLMVNTSGSEDASVAIISHAISVHEAHSLDQATTITASSGECG